MQLRATLRGQGLADRFGGRPQSVAPGEVGEDPVSVFGVGQELPEVFQVNVPEPARALAVLGFEERALYDQDFHLRKPRLPLQHLRPGIGQVGHQRHVQGFRNLHTLLAELTNGVRGEPGELALELALAPGDEDSQGGGPVGGEEKPQAKVVAQQNPLTRGDGVHLHRVRLAALHGGAQAQELPQLVRKGRKGVNPSWPQVLELALGGPGQKTRHVIGMPVGGHHMLHGYQGTEGKASVQGQAELGEEHHRPLSSTGAPYHQQLAPGALQFEPSHPLPIHGSGGYCQPARGLFVLQGVAETVLLAQAVDGETRELVARAQAGDRKAVARLIARYEVLVWRICRALLPPGEDLEGAVQEVWLRVIENLESFRGNGQFVAWVARIAANYCRDLWRRRSLASVVPLEGGDEENEGSGNLVAVLPAAEVDPERALRARQGWQRLQEALSRLSARQREAFGLRFLANLDLKATAEVMGVDVGTVKTHLHRAVSALREAVEEAWP